MGARAFVGICIRVFRVQFMGSVYWSIIFITAMIKCEGRVSYAIFYDAVIKM